MGKLDDKMRTEIKKRRKSPRPVPNVSKESLRVPNGVRDRFTQEGAPILLAVEKSIVETFHEYPQVTDADVGRALKDLILSRSTPGQLAQHVVVELQSMRKRLDLTDQEFLTALKIIYDSVRTRSGFRAGERSYLSYAKSFTERRHPRK